jgi:hypothetical protein
MLHTKLERKGTVLAFKASIERVKTTLDGAIVRIACFADSVTMRCVVICSKMAKYAVRLRRVDIALLVARGVEVG